jgi:AraC-like DNA-binding protein
MTPELFKQLSTETLSAAFPLAVISLAGERSINPEKIIVNTGVTLDQLQRPSARITALAMGAIIYNFVRRVKDPSIGFELGLRSSQTKIGLLGFGLMSCSTYREALAMSLKYSRTLTPFYSLNIIETEEQTIVDVTEATPLDPFRNLGFDIFFSEAWTIACSLLEPKQLANAQETTEIWFDRPEPDYFEKFKSRLPIVRWDMPSNQIRYNRSMLDYPIKTANSTSAQIVAEQCEKEMSLLGYHENILDKVRGHLICRDGSYPNLVAIAQHLHMSDRTLKRKLRQKGVTFIQLLNEVRQRDSLSLLQTTQLTIDDIASRVGYSTPTNFSRAFRQWTGKTPGRCRKEDPPIL